MKILISVILIILSLLCGCTFSEPEPTELTTAATTEPPILAEPGSYLETYTDPVTEAYLDYYVHFPNRTTAGMPLLVFLHGDGEVAQPWLLENFGPIKAARDIYGEDFPFILLSPCTRTTSWTSGRIPDTLMGLIEQTTEKYQVDRDRIMITGHSRGAMGVWNMVNSYGSYFSCAVPVSCSPGIDLDCEMFSQVPIRAMVGTVGDLERGYGQSMQLSINALTKAGNTAELIILKGLSHPQTSTAAYIKETFRWMLEQ